MNETKQEKKAQNRQKLPGPTRVPMARPTRNRHTWERAVQRLWQGFEDPTANIVNVGLGGRQDPKKEKDHPINIKLLWKGRE